MFPGEFVKISIYNIFRPESWVFFQKVNTLERMALKNIVERVLKAFKVLLHQGTKYRSVSSGEFACYFGNLQDL